VLNSIDRIMIATDDLEKAQRDAVSLLGRTPSWQGDYPALGVRYVLFCLENTRIELLAPTKGEEDGLGLREHLEQEGPGLFGLALATPDIEEAVRQVKEKGWESEGVVSLLAQDGPSGAYRRLSQSALDRTGTRGIRLFLTQTLTEDDLIPPALPIGEEAATVTRLDHVVIGTQDPDHALSFYGEGLGIHLALDRTFESRGIRLLFFRLGGTTLEFSAPIREGAELSEGSEKTDRLWGLAYQVPDADRAWSRLEEAGFKTTEVRPGHKAGTRVLTVKSPSLGIPTLVIEPSA
jgi:catechol 2,3-dioxygenase-like lactoylglutathione lyase family enzyme